MPRDASELSPVLGAITNSTLAGSTLAVHRRHPTGPPRAGAQPLHLYREREHVPGNDRPAEADVRERGDLPREAIVGQQGDPARLGERFDLEDAREHRIPGEVPGEDLLGAGDVEACDDPLADDELLDRVDEPEGRPVGEQLDRTFGTATTARTIALASSYQHRRASSSIGLEPDLSGMAVVFPGQGTQEPEMVRPGGTTRHGRSWTGRKASWASLSLTSCWTPTGSDWPAPGRPSSPCS